MLLAEIVARLIETYLVIGLLVALAFVVREAGSAVGSPVSVPGRLLLIPGAALLWPLILRRWVGRHRGRRE